MGGTVPSFRMLLEGIVEELSAFRRALRGEDRAAFDSFMNKARLRHVLIYAVGTRERDQFAA